MDQGSFAGRAVGHEHRASQIGSAGPSDSMLNDMVQHAVASMQQGAAAFGALAMTSARVAERQANFRVVMQSRIDGIKTVQDLSLKAIQKSGTQGG